MSETAKTAPRRAWTTPELKKLGTIADVAANQSAVTTQNPSKS